MNKPPNYRLSPACDTCKYSTDKEQTFMINCEKFEQKVSFDYICDEYIKRETKDEE